MTKLLLGIDTSKIKFEKTVGDIDLTLNLLLKGNWDPKTRNYLENCDAYSTEDNIIKWAVIQLNSNSFLPQYWSKVFLNTRDLNWYQTFLPRVFSFILFFIFQIILNWFLVLKLLIKDYKLNRLFLEFTSVYSFVWLFTVNQFMQYGRPRITVVNIVKNLDNNYLLAKRRHQWIPGDEGWGWFQGGLEYEEEAEFLSNVTPNYNNTVILNLFQDLSLTQQQILINRAKIELGEETNLNLNKLELLDSPKFSGDEVMSISIKRFLLLGCSYNSQEKYLVSWKYNDTDCKIKTDFENAAGDWFEKDQVSTILVPEKLKDWLVFNN